MHTELPHDDCFAVRQAARHISQLYERHLSEARITPTQFSIVSALHREPSMTMAGLAQAMVMDRTTLLRVLRPLLRDGLVEAQPHDACGRRLLLRLTESGRAKFAEATRYCQAAQDEFEAKFGRREAARLRRELFRLTRD
jgi:DNA-binding MarR family transcriptional regulator